MFALAGMIWGGVGVSGKGQRLAVGSAGELVCAGGRAAAAVASQRSNTSEAPATFMKQSRSSAD